MHPVKHFGEMVLTFVVCGALGGAVAVIGGQVGDWVRRCAPVKHFLLAILCFVRREHRMGVIWSEPAGLYCRRCGLGVPDPNGRRPPPRWQP